VKKNMRSLLNLMENERKNTSPKISLLKIAEVGGLKAINLNLCSECREHLRFAGKQKNVESDEESHPVCRSCEPCQMGEGQSWLRKRMGLQPWKSFSFTTIKSFGLCPMI
jgi:hypothetical protein